MSATRDSHMPGSGRAPRPATLLFRPVTVTLGPLRLLLAVGPLLAAAGCGDAGPPEEFDVVRTDSAGVTIVTSRDRVGGARGLAPTPLLAIGRLDGPDEYQLFRVVGAHRLSDGRVAIANAGSSEIRI